MQKIIIPEIGEVELRKSKRARRLILKVNQEGRAVVTLPSYVSYKVADSFVRSHLDWLQKNISTAQPVLLEPGKAVGRRHTLSFKVSLADNRVPKSLVSNGSVTITHAPTQQFDSEEVQKEAKKASIRALRKEAEAHLPPLLHAMASKHGYSYREVRIKSVQTRWGSCSTNRVINLSVWLMQLPDELIEYVICHELTHLNHMNHQASFWEELSNMIPDYKIRRTQIKQFAPRLL